MRNGLVLNQHIRWEPLPDDFILLDEQQVDQERQRAEQERQRADKLAAKLRELGINPASELAESG